MSVVQGFTYPRRCVSVPRAPSPAPSPPASPPAPGSPSKFLQLHDHLRALKDPLATRPRPKKRKKEPSQTPITRSQAKKLKTAPGRNYAHSFLQHTPVRAVTDRIVQGNAKSAAAFASHIEKSKAVDHFFELLNTYELPVSDELVQMLFPPEFNDVNYIKGCDFFYVFKSVKRVPKGEMVVRVSCLLTDNVMPMLSKDETYALPLKSHQNLIKLVDVLKTKISIKYGTTLLACSKSMEWLQSITQPSLLKFASSKGFRKQDDVEIPLVQSELVYYQIFVVYYLNCETPPKIYFDISSVEKALAKRNDGRLTMYRNADEFEKLGRECFDFLVDLIP